MSELIDFLSIWSYNLGEFNLGAIFMEYINYISKEAKTSRSGYVWYCMFENFITILVTDAFLAKLLKNIGISDSLTGIISSFVSLAFLFQLLSIFVLKRKINAKALCITFETIGQLCFVFLYVVPFLPASSQLKSLLVVAAIMVAYALKYVVSSILFRWTNSYVDPMQRGSFSAIKEMISLAGGMVFSFVMGVATDKFFECGNEVGAFIFIAVSVFVLTVINFFCLSKVKNCNINTTQSAKVPMKTVLEKTLFNKKFLPVIIATSLYSFGTYITAGFLGVYKTKDLLISLSVVSIIGGVASAARMLVSKPFGRYSDKKSYAKAMELGYFIIAAGFLSIVFTVPDTWWLMIVYTVLSSVGSAGVVQNTVNIAYNYVEEEYISQAMAFRSAISGIVGFFGALVGAKILEMVQTNGNMLFGIYVYGQQVMALISFVCIMISVAIIHFVIAKNKVTIQ